MSTQCYEATYKLVDKIAVRMVGGLSLAHAAKKAAKLEGSLGELIKLELTDKVIL